MRESAPTRFPKLARKTDAEVARMSPTDRLVYQSALEHEDLWGHLPPQLQAKLRGVSALAPESVENHARERGTDPVHFAAAKAFHRWPIGKEMSSEDFDAAVEEVLSQRHG